MAQHRQLNAKALEAGGQLFGTVSEEVVRVVKATGPYRKDERSRSRYRSHPGIAQQMIDTQSRVGLLYLGEWHSHAQDMPSPSPYDIAAMTTLQARSKLNTTSILLFIVGRRNVPGGICVSSFSQEGRVAWFSAGQPLGHHCLASLPH